MFEKYFDQSKKRKRQKKDEDTKWKLKYFVTVNHLSGRYS